MHKHDFLPVPTVIFFSPLAIAAPPPVFFLLCFRSVNKKLTGLHIFCFHPCNFVCSRSRLVCFSLFVCSPVDVFFFDFTRHHLHFSYFLVHPSGSGSFLRSFIIHLCFLSPVIYIFLIRQIRAPKIPSSNPRLPYKSLFYYLANMYNDKHCGVRYVVV